MLLFCSCSALPDTEKFDSALCVHAVMAPRKRTTRQRKNDPKKAKLDAFLQDFDSEGQCLFHVVRGHWSYFYFLFLFIWLCKLPMRSLWFHSGEQSCADEGEDQPAAEGHGQQCQHGSSEAPHVCSGNELAGIFQWVHLCLFVFSVFVFIAFRKEDFILEK